MSLPKLHPAQAPDVLFAEISDYVRQADKLTQKGEATDLTGLDIAIRALCDGVMKLPVEQAKAYNDKLQELMLAIEAMQEKMIALQGKIAVTMKSLGKQKKAAKAYLNAPGVKVED